MTTLATTPRWTRRLAAAALTLGLAAATVVAYQAALESTGQAVGAALTRSAPQSAASALVAASRAALGSASALN